MYFTNPCCCCSWSGCQSNGWGNNGSNSEWIWAIIIVAIIIFFICGSGKGNRGIC